MAYLDALRDDRYWPRQIEEIEGSGVPLINEPIRDEVIELRPGQAVASLRALLVGALLDRLETRAVHVPREGQREVVRALYVAADALANVAIWFLARQCLGAGRVAPSVFLTD